MKSIFTHWPVLVCVLNVPRFLCRNAYNTHRNAITKATTFKPQVLAKTCYLKPDKGPCRGNIRTYYFDSDDMVCKMFLWGGCQGNGNRYSSLTECQEACISREGYRPPKPKWCQLAFDYGYCFGATDRWYFDRFKNVCLKTIYSGCGGNQNNFYNKEQCNAVCLYGKKPLSRTTKHQGLSKKIIIINPWDAEKKGGRYYTTASQKTTTTMITGYTETTTAAESNRTTILDEKII